jgi:hypothetical protein
VALPDFLWVRTIGSGGDPKNPFTSLSTGMGDALNQSGRRLNP